MLLQYVVPATTTAALAGCGSVSVLMWSRVATAAQCRRAAIRVAVAWSE